MCRRYQKCTYMRMSPPEFPSISYQVSIRIHDIFTAKIHSKTPQKL